MDQWRPRLNNTVSLFKTDEELKMPIEKLLNTAKDNPAISGALSGVVGGTLASALTSRKSARGLLKTGGLIAIGGLAWKAYDSYRKNASTVADETDAANAPVAIQPAHHAEPEKSFIPEVESNATLIIDAMIAAAHADDHLSEIEKQRIWEEVLKSSLPATVLDEISLRLNHPSSTAEIAQQADSMALKIEVYTASLLVLDDSCQTARQYLDDLAVQLELPKPLQQALDSSVEKTSAAA